MIWRSFRVENTTILQLFRLTQIHDEFQILTNQKDVAVHLIVSLFVLSRVELAFDWESNIPIELGIKQSPVPVN